MRLMSTLLATVVLLAGATSMAADTSEEAPKAGPGQIGEDSDYIIGPGDEIQIFVWRNQDLSRNVTVRPDGKISAPAVDDLVAVGHTPSELARLVEARLAEYVRSPQVNIIISKAMSAFSKITVIGQVKTPQAVPYLQGMTVLDVVLAVGGLGDFAAGNRAKIIRKDAKGKEKEIHVKLADLINKGKTRENVAMRPGDILVVPESIL